MLIAAPAAHVVRRNAGAVAADRHLLARVAHQPPGLTALRAGGLRVQRARRSSAADRTLGPLRGRTSRAAAVRAGLRSDRRARAAQHPPAALAAARPDLPAVLARGGRTGPADRAQVRVAVDGEADDRADPAAPAAGPDRPLVAALAPRPAFAVTAGGQLATLAARLGRARRAMRALRLLASAVGIAAG